MTAFWLSHPALRWTAFAVMAAGSICAVILLVVRRTPASTSDAYFADREAEIGHVVMLAAMAVMVGAPTLELNAWWTVLFGLLAAFYAVRIVQHVRSAKAGSAQDSVRAWGAGYHLIASLAMVYATADHGHHAQHGALTWPFGSGPPWLTWLLVALFLADALFTAVVLVTGRLPNTDEPAMPRGTRVAVVPHLVMDLAMVLML